MDLLRFGESTYIASHLPSRIWGHIGNPTRDFSPRPLGSKQLPKILASWLFHAEPRKKFLNQLQKDGRKRRRRRRFPFSCVSLILRFWLWRRYSRFILARIFVKNSAKNARDRVRAVVSPSFPGTAPSRPQITQVLAYLHLVFATSPLSVSLKQTTGTQARLTLESKAFYHLRPPLFILSLAGDKLTALTQGQICLKGPVYWEWRISPSSKFSQKPITAFHTI